MAVEEGDERARRHDREGGGSEALASPRPRAAICHVAVALSNRHGSVHARSRMRIEDARSAPRSLLTARGGILLFASGLVVRLLLLPLWGTFDTEVQKAWATRAATAGLAGVYGPDDPEMLRVARAETGSAWGLVTATNLPRARIEWENGTFIVDYPPGSLVVLWAAGRSTALRPDMPNRPLFNAVVNLAPLVGSPPSPSCSIAALPPTRAENAASPSGSTPR